MFRAVVNASAGASAELEAVTAERDFFREKYAEQMNEMEHMKVQMKESQRVIDRLRGQILDLEIEKAGLMEEARGLKSPSGGLGSTDTSVTALTSSDDDLTAKSSVEKGDDSEKSDRAGDHAAASAESADAGILPADSQESEQSTPDKGGEDEEVDEDEEASDIRANAARMLLWANYQTSKRTTPNTSLIQDDDSRAGTVTSARSLRRDSTTPTKLGLSPTRLGLSPNAIVYSLPTSLDKRRLLGDDDDDSSLGSNSRHHSERSVASFRSGGNDRQNIGKVGKLLGNLRDMIDPPSERDDDSSEGSYH